jgi:hypothetical protein
MKPNISSISYLKKTVLFIAIALFSINVFAVDKGNKELEASATLKDALSKEFNGASDVKWYSEDNKTYMAKFTLKEHNVTAYFDKAGSLLATRRYISEEQLPMAVSNRLSKRFPGEQVRWVVEFDSEGSTVYFITTESEKGWKVIKSTANGECTVQQRLNKA